VARAAFEYAWVVSTITRNLNERAARSRHPTYLSRAPSRWPSIDLDSSRHPPVARSALHPAHCILAGGGWTRRASIPRTAIPRCVSTDRFSVPHYGSPTGLGDPAARSQDIRQAEERRAREGPAFPLTAVLFPISSHGHPLRRCSRLLTPTLTGRASVSRPRRVTPGCPRLPRCACAAG